MREKEIFLPLNLKFLVLKVNRFYTLQALKLKQDNS